MQALPKRAVAETLGTAMLLAAVVGSGIMGERLAAGNVAVALLANTIATGAALVVLILTFGPISGAHINPAVTFASAWQRHTPWREVPVYVSAQTGGAILGVVVAHLMFELPLLSVSQHARAGSAQMFSEFCGDLWLAAGDLGGREISAGGSAVRGGCLHHRGLLVYGFDFVCEPRSDDRAIADRYVHNNAAPESLLASRSRPAAKECPTDCRP
jgi:hypothetical protein